MATPLRTPPRDEGPPPAGPRWNQVPIGSWSITTWLVVIDVVVFIADQVFHAPVLEWGYFSVSTALRQGQVWRFITFQFLHADVQHLFFNMLALYFFGKFIESFLGRSRYLAFYLVCGMAGAVAYIVLWRLHVLRGSQDVGLIGASAGVFGILIAAARVAPNMTVILMFPPIPMKLRTMAWLFIGLAVVTIASKGWNAGGEAAHLGGAAAGAVLIANPRWLAVFQWPRPKKTTSRFWKPGDPPAKFFRDE